MAITLRHTTRAVNIVFISRDTGKMIGYVVPVDLVLFLLWFLGSAAAQALAVAGMTCFYQLYQGWLWLIDWPAWAAGLRVVVEDFRRVGRLVYVAG